MEPAFTPSRTLEAHFSADEVLRFDGGGRLAVVKGRLRRHDAQEPGHEGDDEVCLLQIEQRAAVADEGALLAALPRLELALTNHSGAEYSYYDATLPAAGSTRYNVEVICPASARQVERKRPSRVVLVEESAEVYARIVRPHAVDQAARLG